MSAALELSAEVRVETGKAASRRLRRLEDKIPAVVYGAAEEGQNLTLKGNQLSKVMQSDSFFSQILNIEIDGKSQQVILKDLHRSPDTGKVLHVDFLRVRADQEINVNIPLHFVNEESCVGVKVGGGLITHNLVEVEISCLPANLPESIEVDVAELEVGNSLYLSDLAVPEQVSIVALATGESERDIPVVTVSVRRGGTDDLDEGLEMAGEDSAAGASDTESDSSADGDGTEGSDS